MAPDRISKSNKKTSKTQPRKKTTATEEEASSRTSLFPTATNDQPIRRSSRENRGTGGAVAQLAKTSEIIGKDLLQKRNRSGITKNSTLTDTPMDPVIGELQTNNMAPPSKKVRGKATAPIVPTRPDPPLAPSVPLPQLYVDETNLPLGALGQENFTEQNPPTHTTHGHRQTSRFQHSVHFPQGYTTFPSGAHQSVIQQQSSHSSTNIAPSIMPTSGLNHANEPQFHFSGISSDTNYLDRQYGQLEFFPQPEDSCNYLEPPASQMDFTIDNTHRRLNTLDGQTNLPVAQWNGLHHEYSGRSMNQGLNASTNLEAGTELKDNIYDEETEEGDDENGGENDSAGANDEECEVDNDEHQDGHEDSEDYDSDGEHDQHFLNNDRQLSWEKDSDNLVIDEQSPDEDEQQAVNALQNFVHKENQAITVDNVLQLHLSRNRANKSPNPDRLHVAAQAQGNGLFLLSASPSARSSPEIEQEVPSNDDSESNIPLNRAKRNSKLGQKKPDPTILQFYPDTWQVVITKAKISFRQYLVLFNGFPDRAKHLFEAASLLTSAIQDGIDQGLILNPAFSQNRPMNIVVFKEAATYRCILKNICRKQVMIHYRDFLDESLVYPDFEGGNQLEMQERISEAVASILGTDSQFLHGGVDDQGRTNNISHPCIKAVCLEFFYTGPDCLAHHFPQDFNSKIPEQALALVMTCIYNCLEEYTCGYFMAIPFSAARYELLYEAMQDIIEQVKGNSYHGEKLDKNLRNWAQAGMRHLNPASNTKSKLRLRAKLD